MAIFYMLDLAVLNSWVIYTEVQPDSSFADRKHGGRKRYTGDLAITLITFHVSARSLDGVRIQTVQAIQTVIKKPGVQQSKGEVQREPVRVSVRDCYPSCVVYGQGVGYKESRKKREK